MKKSLAIVILLGVVLIYSCKKDDPENPYENVAPATSNPETDDIPMDNFAWLQAKVFKPTCANSGCHDGTFEPEFNTIASSYNSIVNHPVITNDESGSFEYRVAPNDANSSLLYERLINFIPNTSGIMPLDVDADSDWLEESDNYIARIQEWINTGAKDMFGNPAPSADTDFPPQANGFLVFPGGTTSDAYQRDPEEVGITPILVDAAPIDLWIAISDDNTAVSSMNENSIKWTENPEEFDLATEVNYTIETGVSGLDFGNSAVTFYHKASIDLSGMESGTTIFIRNYLDDFQQSSLTEIPNDGSNAVLTALFVIKIQ